MVFEGNFGKTFKVTGAHYYPLCKIATTYYNSIQTLRGKGLTSVHLKILIRINA